MRTIPVGLVHKALVDDCDFEALSKLKWHAKHRAGGQIYAATNLPNGDGTYRWRMMHQLIFPEYAALDHADADGLNNCRSNLRQATQSQNTANARKKRGSVSSYKGVSFDSLSPRKPWRVSAFKDGKKLFEKRFRTELHAAIAYDEAARMIHGEFARLNFPDGAPDAPPELDPVYTRTCKACEVTFTTRMVGQPRKFCTICRPPA